jgi:beta-phosphoglucomutase
MLAAALYDMNGVLVDDEPLHEAAFRKVLSDLGLDLDHASYQEFFAGRTDEDGFARFLAANPVEHPEISQLLEEKSAAYQDLAADGLEKYPGAVESIQGIAESDVALGLVTSSLRAEAEAVMRAFDLENYFSSAIVTAEDIETGKPDPSGYLLGAAKLGVDPAHIAVIEDAPSGITAAHSAGMRVLAVTQTHTADELSEADLILPKLGPDTVEALRSLVAGD